MEYSDCYRKCQCFINVNINYLLMLILKCEKKYVTLNSILLNANQSYFFKMLCEKTRRTL